MWSVLPIAMRAASYEPYYTELQTVVQFHHNAKLWAWAGAIGTCEFNSVNHPHAKSQLCKRTAQRTWSKCQWTLSYPTSDWETSGISVHYSMRNCPFYHCGIESSLDFKCFKYLWLDFRCLRKWEQPTVWLSSMSELSFSKFKVALWPSADFFPDWLKISQRKTRPH